MTAALPLLALEALGSSTPAGFRKTLLEGGAIVLALCEKEKEEEATESLFVFVGRRRSVPTSELSKIASFATFVDFVMGRVVLLPMPLSICGAGRTEEEEGDDESGLSTGGAASEEDSVVICTSFPRLKTRRPFGLASAEVGREGKRNGR